MDNWDKVMFSGKGLQVMDDMLAYMSKAGSRRTAMQVISWTSSNILSVLLAAISTNAIFNFLANCETPPRLCSVYYPLSRHNDLQNLFRASAATFGWHIIPNPQITSAVDINSSTEDKTEACKHAIAYMLRGRSHGSSAPSAGNKPTRWQQNYSINANVTSDIQSWWETEENWRSKRISSIQKLSTGMTKISVSNVGHKSDWIGSR